jgi:predicted DNA-binding transcriptional regulator AlpA
MPLLKLNKSNQQMAKPVDKPLRPAGKSDLAEVLRRLERDVELASAKPQVKIVKRHEAAALLGVSTRTLQRWHKQGFGPRRSIGKRFYYIESEIQEWIASHGRGGKRSDSSERSLKNTNSNSEGTSPAVNCTKVDTPMAFVTPEDANSTPCDKPAAINCTKVDTQNAGHKPCP